MLRSGSNPAHQVAALELGLNAEPFELVREPHIGMQPGWVLVEVEEGAGPLVEDATLLLDKARDGAQLRKQWFESIEARGSGVPHDGRVGRLLP